MTDLFGNSTGTPKPKTEPGDNEAPNLWLLAARRIGGFGDDWHWYRMEMIGPMGRTQGCMVTGGVPTKRYTKGPRAGQWNWSEFRDGAAQSVFVSHAERDAETMSYEANGKCAACGGTGQSWAGSGPNGSVFRPCPRCKATGKAPGLFEGAGRPGGKE